MCPDSSKFVQTAQNISGQSKMCLDSSLCVRKVQYMSGQVKICLNSSKYVYIDRQTEKICLEMHFIFFQEAFTYFLLGHKRRLRIFLICPERYLRVFHPEDFWVPPGRLRIFRPLYVWCTVRLYFNCKLLDSTTHCTDRIVCERLGAGYYFVISRHLLPLAQLFATTHLSVANLHSFPRTQPLFQQTIYFNYPAPLWLLSAWS